MPVPLVQGVQQRRGRGLVVDGAAGRAEEVVDSVQNGQVLAAAVVVWHGTFVSALPRVSSTFVLAGTPAGRRPAGGSSAGWTTQERRRHRLPGTVTVTVLFGRPKG